LSWTETKILNPSRSDFKYLSDFGFLKNCWIPSDLDADSESVTSLTTRFWEAAGACVPLPDSWRRPAEVAPDRRMGTFPPSGH